MATKRQLSMCALFPRRHDMLCCWSWETQHPTPQHVAGLLPSHRGKLKAQSGGSNTLWSAAQAGGVGVDGIVGAKTSGSNVNVLRNGRRACTPVVGRAFIKRHPGRRRTAADRHPRSVPKHPQRMHVPAARVQPANTPFCAQCDVAMPFPTQPQTKYHPQRRPPPPGSCQCLPAPPGLQLRTQGRALA
jgi:hypothetical protein